MEGIKIIAICSYRVTVKLWSLFVSEVQGGMVFMGKITHPNHRVFQQKRHICDEYIQITNDNYGDLINLLRC